MSDVDQDAPPVESTDDDYEAAFNEFATARAGGKPEPEDEPDVEDDTEPEEAEADEADSEGGEVDEAEQEAPVAEEVAPDPLAALRSLGLDPERAAHEVKSNRERISALQRKINEQASIINRAATKKPQEASDEAPDGFSDKEWAALKEELPEVAKAVEARLAAMEAKMQKALGQATEPIRQFEYTQHLSKEEAALEAAHPGWREVVKQESFRSWLSAQPYQVQQIAESDAAAEAAWMLDRFKRDTGTPAAQEATPKAAPTGPSEVARIGKQRDRRLKESAGIQSRSGQGGQSGPPEDYEAAFEYFARKRQATAR